MCVLLLRGPQTVGEIKGRTERLYLFDSIEDVSHILESLAKLDYVVRMPRQAGQKEVRYGHLMCGQPEEPGADVYTHHPNASGDTSAVSERLAVLEEKVESLSSALEELKRLFEDLKLRS